MSEHESMDGRYYRTCADDIVSSRGWFKNVLLLGLVNIVPIFGQMTISGYAYEWAHKAAWGVKSPMPYKIYGRASSKMLRWGWFALVIAFVFAIVPYIVYAIGGAISGAAEAPASAGMYLHGHGSSAGFASAFGVACGGVIQFVGWIGMIVAGIFAWAGTIRMTIYDRLGTGLQFGQVWKMVKRDFGGLLRIFGMQLLVGLIICILGAVIFSISAAIGLGGAFLVAFSSAGDFTPESSSGLYGLIMMALSILPLLLIDGYIVSCMVVYAQLLVTRAVGYWCRQFSVDEWGTKDEPFPFEREQAADPGHSERPQRPEEPAAEHAASGSAPGEAGEHVHPDSQEGTAGPAETAQSGHEEPVASAAGEDGHTSTGPVGWRAAGTSAADKRE